MNCAKKFSFHLTTSSSSPPPSSISCSPVWWLPKCQKVVSESKVSNSNSNIKLLPHKALACLSVLGVFSVFKRKKKKKKLHKKMNCLIFMYRGVTHLMNITLLCTTILLKIWLFEPLLVLSLTPSYKKRERKNSAIITLCINCDIITPNDSNR